MYDGKQSGIATIVVDNIDKTNPVLDITSGQSGVQIIDDVTSAASVTVTANDENFASIKYSKDGSEYTVKTDSVISLTQRGTYTVTAEDKAGNEVTKNITLIDGPKVVTSPLISNGQISNKPITATVQGSDVTLSVNGTPQTDKVVTLAPESGSMDYKLVATDKYSNKATLTFTVDLDAKDAPEITYTPTTPTNLQGEVNAVTVTITYPSDVTGMTYTITYEDGTTETKEDASQTETFTITKNATVSASYTAGAIKVVEITNIDTIAPEINIASAQSGVDVKETAQNEYATSADSVSVSVSDTGLGLDKVTYSVDGSAPIDVNNDTITFSQRGEYEVNAYDKAGNVTTKKITLVNAPALS